VSKPLVVQGLAALGEVRKVMQARLQAEREAAQRAAAAALAREREHTLFLRTVGEVTPLPQRGQAVIERPRPAPVPRQRERDEQAVLREALSDEFDAESLMETDDQLSYRRSGVGIDVLGQLRRGRWVVQGQIDLHGLTRDEAREALGGFLQGAGKRGWRCVRVVHGKGLGSPRREPVLKGKVRAWLVQRQDVLAFTQARGPDGGAGALIVLLDSAPSRLERRDGRDRRRQEPGRHGG
jgi:DNA-nicking Smr family endonuclease